MASPQRTSSSLSTVSTGGRTDSGIIDPAIEERLSSLLQSPNFTVAQYLNLAFSSSSSEDDDDDYEQNTNNSSTTTSISPEEQEQQLEQRMASLALQLQMRTQSCHDEIGRIGAELQAIVPRCAGDVGRLQVGLEGMELDVRGLLEGMDGGINNTSSSNSSSNNKKNVMRTSDDNGADISAGLSSSSDNNKQNQSATNNNNNSGDDPLTTLHSLLNLRTHLTTARAILLAASSWDETINSIPMLLSTTPPNLVEAVAALSQLEQGERALQGMPEGRDDREAALKKLRTQLEVLLKPQLLHALKKMDTRLGPLQQCVGMYDSLGKMVVMREEYVKIRPVEIHALWFSFGGGGGGGDRSGSSGNSNNNNNTPAKAAKEKSHEGDEDDEVEDFDFDEDENNENSASPFTSAATATHQQTTAKEFMEFLPTFYEAVLELLAKERTQSKLVFGPDLAPLIVARVLLECFKPIVASFEKRLGNVCPAPGSLASHSINSDGVGGTEAIAAAYESTIQFLSLAYDQMEAWNGVTTEGGKDVKKTDAANVQEDPANETLHSIRSAFLLIASPFLPYQQALSVAERDPMGEAASMVAKDVRGVVNFEDAAERLGDLAPFMFPLAEAAINRFELLNSGYNAPASLSSIDKLISNHAAELAIAMGTLSTNASNSSGPEFDEQHINCALEILRIAGMFKRNLRSFELSVKERLRMLSKVMVDTVLDNDEEADIPDELSPVQIRAVLAKQACDPSPTYIDDGTGVKKSTSVVELQRLAGQSSLFPKSLDSTSRLARSCLSLVFEVCSAIPERNLRGISTLPVWREEGGDEDEESYGILPQAFMTHVGEHMLALVQALEPFASDDEALGLANEVMSDVMEVSVQPWKEFVAAAGCSFMGNEKTQLEILMKGKDIKKYFLDNEDDDDEIVDDDVQDDDEEEEEGESAVFCNKWLDVVGLAVTGRLLERTMRIPRLSKSGAEHLATDLNYICNVFTALGITGHPHPLLGYMAQLVTLDDESLRSTIQRRRADTEVSEALEVIKRAELRIAYVRNISV